MTYVSKQDAFSNQNLNKSKTDNSKSLNIYRKNSTKGVAASKIESVEKFLKRGGEVQKVENKKRRSK